ncbi:MAG: pyruvate dehydrogenase (acetyl-transferring) E1 component subunit alpha, partial [Thermodesulfobacteriota bacterium]|nr:pyruvate dehydrogenase (acetyl-transferring) E1 component subunit alpha [Thermodesulfobacteriota bacterium]
RFQTYLKDKGLLSEEDIIQLETEIAEDVQGVVDRAEKRMQEEVDPLSIFDHTFAELPPSLIRQRQEMEHELSLMQEEASHD